MKVITKTVAILTAAASVVAAACFASPASAGVVEMKQELHRLGVRVEVGPTKCYGLFGVLNLGATGGYSKEYNTICVSEEKLDEVFTLEKVLAHESVHYLQHHYGVVDPGFGVDEEIRVKKAITLQQYSGVSCKVMAMEAVAWTAENNPQEVLKALKEAKGKPKMEVSQPSECAPKPSTPRPFGFGLKLYLFLLGAGFGGFIIYMLCMSVMNTPLFQKWKEKWEYDNMRGDENPFMCDF
jgi:hypothetical protein